ncbi:MAG: ParB/RepB/Spo0J family partition protein [Candidatus Bathyarchaeia archaeon]|jgi:ParB/RepB/Spo0J family partition protein
MQIKISQIKTSKRFNPREALDRTEVQSLKLSMKAIGQQEQIIVREQDKELINGLHRIAAAKALGWKTIDAKLVTVTDQEARILALVSNNFGKRLNHLELGRNIFLILEGVNKREGRGEVKQQLANKLGLSVKEVEDCLATYRNLNPEARNLSSYAVGKRILHVEQLREIRQLPAEKQVAILKQVVKVKDAQAADRLVTAFLAAQDSPVETQEPSRPEIKPSEANQVEKNGNSTILGLDPVIVEMPWLRYLSAVTNCPFCKGDRAVDFSRTKLSSTKDQLVKIRSAVQEWLDANPVEAT